MGVKFVQVKGKDYLVAATINPESNDPEEAETSSEVVEQTNIEGDAEFNEPTDLSGGVEAGDEGVSDE